MKTKSIICPNCGGSADIVPGQKKIYCEYCGTPLLIDDDDESENTAGKTLNTKKIKEKLQKNHTSEIESNSKKGFLSGINADNCNQYIAIWLIGFFVLFSMIEPSDSTIIAGIFLAWWIGGGYLLITKMPVVPKLCSDKRMPFYFTIPGIVLIGLATLCIFWMLGPFFRGFWKKKRGL